MKLNLFFSAAISALIIGNASASSFDCINDEYMRTRFRCTDDQYLLCVHEYQSGALNIHLYNNDARWGRHYQEEKAKIRETDDVLSIKYSLRVWPISMIRYALKIDKERRSGTFLSKRSGIGSGEDVVLNNLQCEEL